MLKSSNPIRMIEGAGKKVLRGIENVVRHKSSISEHSHRFRKKIGLSPGSLIYVGEQKQEKVKVTLVNYDADQIETLEGASIDECVPYMEKPTTKWINIDGLHDTNVIKALEEKFGIHVLALEDCLNTGQRPKLEEFDNFVLIILKMLWLDQQTGVVQEEQVSFILGDNFVISLQEREGDVFVPVRKRLVDNKGRIRKSGADYLLSSLLDTVVDNYFIVTEYLASRLDKIDEEILEDSNPQILQEIYHLKKTIISVRRFIAPLRDAVRDLKSGLKIAFIHERTQPFFRDVFDHLYQVIDSIDLYRDMLGGMLDLYLSTLGHKTNEVMKVLTVIATIFIPITFLAGVYGMNFEYMPELKWRYGYFAVWGVMLGTASMMLLYFRRKRWF